MVLLPSVTAKGISENLRRRHAKPVLPSGRSRLLPRPLHAPLSPAVVLCLTAALVAPQGQHLHIHRARPRGGEPVQVAHALHPAPHQALPGEGTRRRAAARLRSGGGLLPWQASALCDVPHAAASQTPTVALCDVPHAAAAASQTPTRLQSRGEKRCCHHNAA